MVVVGVRLDVEVLKSLAPLLRTLCGGGEAKKKCDVDEAHSEKGLGALDVVTVVNENGQCLV